ncbi:MAG: DUF1016 N-terminal domain-containing protein [bacterium]
MSPQTVATRSTTHVLSIPGTVTPVSLALANGLTYEDWCHVVAGLGAVEGAVQWWLGDALNFGARAYGEKYAQAVDETQAHTWAQYAWVASRFETSTRVEIVPWTVHRDLAGVEDAQERRVLLRRAADELWTVRETRQAVRTLKRGRSTEPSAPSASEPGRTSLGEYVMEWYPEAGMLVIQAQNGHGVVLDRTMLTPKARALLMAFLGSECP